MLELTEALIGGVIVGSVYGLFAIGLSLVYGVTKVWNFAHGSLFTWGAYLAWVSLAIFHLDYLTTCVFVIAIMFLLGLMLERIVIRPLRRVPGWGINVFLATLALSLLLNNVAFLVFGPRKKVIPNLFEGTIHIGDFYVSTHDVAIFLIAIAAVVILELFLRKTRQGEAMRAVAQDTLGARIVGIPTNRVFGYAFAISAVLAGISGILLAPKYLISPLVGIIPFIKAFVIVFLGGLGSIKGTLIAAFILGITEALVSLYLGAVWIMPVFFLVLLSILIVRPRGLFGTW